MRKPKAGLLGSPHAYARLSCPLPTFFDTIIHSGMTQHWALVHDDCFNALCVLADILELETLVL